MPHVGLAWQPAAIIAACVAVLAAVLIRTRRARLVAAGRFAGEAALLFGLFALWQYAGSFSLLPSSGGLPRARWLWHAERLLHLPSEVSVQRLFLPHPLLTEAFNLYYAVLHFPVLIGTLIWVFGWHRGHYRQVRTTVVLFTGASLLIQFIPVAPPRMLYGTGLVDTAARYGQSVYGSLGFDADQYSAMPSVHVGWALIVAIAVITACRGRWRWAALLYPALTLLVVVVTANHFWLDGAVAIVLVLGALGVQRAAGSLRVRWLTRPGHTAVPSSPGHTAAPSSPGHTAVPEPAGGPDAQSAPEPAGAPDAEGRAPDRAGSTAC
ncbi:MAG: phosphatase PAP2 family protein [Streptosporangiaceae bacterium]